MHGIANNDCNQLVAVQLKGMSAVSTVAGSYQCTGIVAAGAQPQQ